MNESVEQLTLVLPRTNPGQPKDWPSVARQLGTELPSDYKEFIETFGGGYVDSYLHIVEPDCPNEACELVDFVEERTEALEYLWDSSEDKPHELAEPGDRLIACAMTDNGEYVYWLAKAGQDPDDWTVMVNEARGEWWEHLDMSFARFLLSSLTGEIRCEILSDDFPTSPHTFHAYSDPSWPAS